MSSVTYVVQARKSWSLSDGRQIENTRAPWVVSYVYYRLPNSGANPGKDLQQNWAFMTLIPAEINRIAMWATLRGGCWDYYQPRTCFQCVWGKTPSPITKSGHLPL